MASSPLVRLVGLGLVVGAAGLGYAAGIEVRSFTVRRVDVPALPRGSRPIRVLHLSDLHLTPRQAHKLAWLESLARLEPDLVVNTGDNLAHPHAVRPVLEALQPLLHLPGVFVLGSNDYFGPMAKNPLGYFGGPSKIREQARRLPVQDLVHGFTEAGWLDLDNARGKIDVDGRLLDLVGVDDPHLNRDRYLDVAGPADTAADLSIGVMHAPYRRVLDAMTLDGVQLLLAGHTHGGQVALPGYGALVTNCDLPNRYAKGLHRWQAPGRGARPDGPKSWLNVSAGLGTSPFAPIRFACPPEATLLTLVASDS